MIRIKKEVEFSSRISISSSRFVFYGFVIGNNAQANFRLDRPDVNTKEINSGDRNYTFCGQDKKCTILSRRLARGDTFVETQNRNRRRNLFFRFPTLCFSLSLSLLILVLAIRNSGIASGIEKNFRKTVTFKRTSSSKFFFSRSF